MNNRPDPATPHDDPERIFSQLRAAPPSASLRDSLLREVAAGPASANREGSLVPVMLFSLAAVALAAVLLLNRLGADPSASHGTGPAPEDETASTWATGEWHVKKISGKKTLIDAAAEIPSNFVYTNMPLDCVPGQSAILCLQDRYTLMCIEMASGSAHEVSKVGESRKEFCTGIAYGITGAGSICSIAASPDGKTAAVGMEDGSIRLVELTGGSEIGRLKQHVDAVTHVEFSKQGDVLYSASIDGWVKVWDVAARQRTGFVGGISNLGVDCLAMSSDGRLAAAVVGSVEVNVGQFEAPVAGVDDFDSAAVIWNLETEERYTVTRDYRRDNDSAGSCVMFDARDRACFGNTNGEITVWDSSTQMEAGVYRVFDTEVRSMRLMPDGLAVVAGASELALWDPATGEVIRRHRRSASELEGDASGIAGLVVEPGGNQFAVATEDGSVYLYWK